MHPWNTKCFTHSPISAAVTRRAPFHDRSGAKSARQRRCCALELRRIVKTTSSPATSEGNRLCHS